jgi:hypothetical protein
MVPDIELPVEIIQMEFLVASKTNMYIISDNPSDNPSDNQ